MPGDGADAPVTECVTAVTCATHVLGIETRDDSAIANRHAGSKFLDLVIITKPPSHLMNTLVGS